MENQQLPPINLSQKNNFPSFLKYLLVFLLIGILVYIGFNQFTQKTNNTAKTPINPPFSLASSPTPTPSKRYSVNVNPVSQTGLYETQEIYIEKAQWVNLHSTSVGVSFDYPALTGVIQFASLSTYQDQSGTLGWSFNWIILPIDKPYGSTIIAAGFSKNWKLEGESFITDFYELESHYSDAIKTFKTKYNTDAVWINYPVYEMNDQGPPIADPNDKGMAILTNLPLKNFNLKGLAIYLPKGITESEAKRIVNSLTISD